MLNWRIKNGDNKLKDEIKHIKLTFDDWYKRSWEKQCTREKMFSDSSPVEHVYYKMTKSFKEVKEKYPYEALQKCSSCGKYVDRWIETEFSFCAEYGCGMSLCKECANKLKGVINKL